MRVWVVLGLFCSVFLTSTHASDFTLSGTCKQADNTNNCTDTGTIRFAFDNTLQTYTQPIVSGSWSINHLTLSPPASGTIITVFIEGASNSQKAVAVTQYDGTGDVIDIELIETHLSIGSGDNPTISNAELALYDNSISVNNDIFYDIDASGNLTVDINNIILNETLYVKAGAVFEPLGSLSTHHVYLNGTLTANSNTFTVVGDWNFTNGAFNRGTSTVNFTGTGTITNDVSNWWNKSFYNLGMAEAGETTTILFGRGVVARGLATLGSGILAGGALTLGKSGTPVIMPDTTLANSAVNFGPYGTFQANIPAQNYPSIWLAAHDTTANFILLGSITCNRLSINGSGVGRTSSLETNGHNISCNNLRVGHPSNNQIGKLTVNNGSTLNIAEDISIFGTGSNELDATSSTINIGGGWLNSSLFTAGTSTVNFNGDSNQTLSAGGDSFHRVIVDNTGVIGDNAISIINSGITVKNDLIILDGGLDTTANNYNLIVEGNLDQSSLDGELKANASTITVTGNFSADGGGTGSEQRHNYSYATIELIGSGTLSYENLHDPSSSGFGSLTVGQLGTTTTITPSFNFTVREVLTVGSGTLTGTSAVIYIEGTDPLNLDPDATIRLNFLRFSGRGFTQAFPPLTNGYDTSIMLSKNNTSVIQTGEITLNSNKELAIVGDGFPHRIVTYNTDGYPLNVGGKIRIGGWMGVDTGLKTLNISGSTVTVGRDFNILLGTNDLISTNSTIILNSTTNGQAVTMNGKAMDTLTLTNTYSAGVAFNDAFSANSVSNLIPNSTMTFEAGQNFTVNNAINLQGASGQLINLVSSSTGNNWNFILNAGASKTIDHVSVSWSDASGSHSTQKPINPSNTVRNNDTIEWFLMPNITVTKNTTLISDPINGTGGGRNRIPSAIIEYSITVRNTGDYSPDNNTVIISDVIDSDSLEFEVNSVQFTDGSPSSGVGLGVVTYAQKSAPANYTYTPTNLFDPNVVGIKIQPSGTFAFGGTPYPEFTVTYRVRIK